MRIYRDPYNEVVNSTRVNVVLYRGLKDEADGA